jgi:hypothetical protein
LPPSFGILTHVGAWQRDYAALLCSVRKFDLLRLFDGARAAVVLDQAGLRANLYRKYESKESRLTCKRAGFAQIL